MAVLAWLLLPAAHAIDYQHGYSYMGEVELAPDFPHLR